MSRRSLGGGRVLGSGRSLAPASASPATPTHHPARFLSSPTPSNLSIDSPSSSSALVLGSSPDASFPARNGRGNSSVPGMAETPSRLACPICDEEMVTLLQLNRHIDDVHQYLEEDQQVEVKDWFQLQVEKAKRFQPLAVLNQKLKGKDVFESNAPAHTVSPSHPSHTRSTSGDSPRLIEPDELVTRDHWQPRNPQFDRCFDPACDKRLTATTGAVNCRKCGKLFCGEHTMYQMKLSRAALHEPVRGVWCRVCETCYKSREGYNDHNGSSRDLTSTFSALRKPHVDKSFLEVARLEKRISRLTSLLASALPADQLQSPASPASPFTSPRTRGSPRWISPFRDDERKKLERTVVSWQDDASVTRCPFCQQEFATYTFRRHHCRTCGRVVCADPATGCSEEVGLTVAGQKSQSRRTPGKKQPVDIDVRLCKDCRTTLFSRADFQAETTTEPPDLRAYRNLRQFETGIQALLPRFQTLLSALQDPDYPPTSEQLAEAAKVRKRLMDAFANYDVAARRIRDLPAASQTQAKLQKAVYLQATGFLHVHMLPLKSLPKILKHAPGSGSGTASAGGSTPTPEQMSKGKGRDGSNVTNATDGDERDKVDVPALEAEETSLRNQLAVLEEQKFLVSEMVADANRRRKFDEAKSLSGNLEELGAEVERLKERVEEVEGRIRGAYTKDGKS